MSLISPNFDVKSIFFPNFGQGPFPQNAGKGPDQGVKQFGFRSGPDLVQNCLQRLSAYYKYLPLAGKEFS